MWFLKAFLIAGFCFFCWAAPSLAQFPSMPKSRPASAPQVVAQAPPAPTTTVVQAAPPVVNVAPPAVTVSSQLVAPTASTLDEIKAWLMTTFLGIVAAAFGKIALMGVKTTAPAVVVPGAVSEPASVLLALRDKATDPGTLAKIDETLLTVLGTGVPSKLVQTGLSMVPGAGPILSGVEPMLHNAFMGFLKDRLEGNTQPRP